MDLSNFSLEGKNAWITGASYGIGFNIAKAFVQAGAKNIIFNDINEAALQRGLDNYKEAGITNVKGYVCDVTDEAAVKAAVDTVTAEQGRIDVLINCAGWGISGAVEFTPLADAKRQLDVNFFGMVNVNRAVIPIMRRQASGRIVNLSSVAGAIPIPFQTYYSASKAAINSYTMATANEIKPFGITMCAVQPGDMATGFTAARNKIAAGDDIYGGRISRSVSGMEKDEQGGKGPEVAAVFSRRVATRKGVKPLNTIGFQYQFFCFLAKILPAKFLNFLVGLIYAK